MSNDEISDELARLRGVVAAIGGVLATTHIQFDKARARQLADAILGPRAPAEAFREAGNTLDLLAQLSQGKP
jgi:hypothetical protein